MTPAKQDIRATEAYWNGRNKVPFGKCISQRIADYRAWQLGNRERRIRAMHAKFAVQS